jgi:exonuclease III
MNMRFGMWNIRSLYKVSSLMTVLRALSRHKLDLVGVQEVKWKGSGTTPAGEYTFFYEKGNENCELGTGFIVHKGIISAVKRIEFVSDRMLYVLLRRSLISYYCSECYAPTEDKIDDVKDRFYGELESIFNKLLKYHMKILL